jgi:hypothetical protein
MAGTRYDVSRTYRPCVIYGLYLRTFGAPRLYVVQTCDIARRLEEHCGQGAPEYLTKAMKAVKYGLLWADVEVYILEENLGGGQRDLDDREAAWTKLLRANYPVGYNHQLMCGSPGGTKQNWGGLLKWLKW